jgi:hypothetical protein
MALDLYDLYKELTNDKILFCFCGSASQLIVEGIGETLLHRMELEGTDTSIVGKVFEIFVEQMQNIVNYSAESVPTEAVSGEELRLGILIVGKEDGNFCVRCGNHIDNSQVEFLTRTLSGLQTMDKSQLKALYKEARKSGNGGDKGAGLGFIDMARKASKPLEFSITPVDENRSFFSLTTII